MDFDALKDGIQQLVDFIIRLVNMIKDFVGKFQTEIHFRPGEIPTSHYNG